MTARFEVAQVRAYYDRHTPAFVTFGGGARVGAIHRAVWGPGIVNRSDAFHYVEDQIARIVARLPPGPGRPTVVDLGCGVGASLGYLAERLPIRGIGVTVSAVQAHLAARRLQEAGLSEQVTCFEGDFLDLPAGLGPADVVYAIESLVHAQRPQQFFEQCARLLRPGGVLVICDDFRGTAAGPAAERTIEQFCSGWHVNALLEPEELHALARAAGFEHTSTVDLSPYLEIHRPRDRAISALLSLLPARAFSHLRGGRALQTCVERGWIRYQLLEFRRLG